MINEKKEQLDLELLNKVFAKEIPFNGIDICSDCNYQCGIDCGKFGKFTSDCSKIIEAKLAHNPLELEDFQYSDSDIFGELKIALDSTHIIGVLLGKVSIDDIISKIYDNNNYCMLKNKAFLNSSDIYCTEEGLYLLPYNNKKVKKWNYIYRKFVNKALKLVDNPELYYSFNNPLVIQNDYFTVLIAVRVEEEEEDW